MLALPAMAQEPITPQTTMREIRQNPAVQASGLYTDIHTWERDLAWFKNVHNNETLEEVVGSGSAASCAAGLNLLIQNYESGTQITYKLYSRNALYYSGELRGGVSTAWELHEQGYAVFVLRYRIGREAGNNAPMDDLGRAIQFITANAETFGVQPEGYALLGYSSGGQIAGVFGDAEKGWQKYNVPKPGALLLAYPINNFWLAKPAYTALLDVDDWMQKHYYDYTLSKLIAPDYPPVFLWYGKSDRILKLFGFDQQGPALQSALETDGVPHEEKVYEDAGHGIGIGLGTDAEGWLNAAVTFWKKVT